jgi:hypothetical protein
LTSITSIFGFEKQDRVTILFFALFTCLSKNVFVHNIVDLDKLLIEAESGSLEIYLYENIILKN